MITNLEEVKSYLGIPDSTLDDKINALIPVVENDYLIIRGKHFDVNGGLIVYPVGANLTAIQMIAFRLNEFGNYSSSASGTLSRNSEVSSENWGDHSISYDLSSEKVGVGSGSIKGYPKVIVDQIERYTNFIKIPTSKFRLNKEKYLSLNEVVDE
jgi:hypothetical protein